MAITTKISFIIRGEERPGIERVAKTYKTNLSGAIRVMLRFAQEHPEEMKEWFDKVSASEHGITWEPIRKGSGSW